MHCEMDFYLKAAMISVAVVLVMIVVVLGLLVWDIFRNKK